MALFWLSDEAWMAIEPHLPKNQPGARRVDDRRVISGILHVLKVGCRWCDCPTDYGPSTTVYNRFNRWSHRGFWLKLLHALVDGRSFGRVVRLHPAAPAGARELCRISELVFGTLTQNRSNLEPPRRALRTAVPLLLILRMEGGTE